MSYNPHVSADPVTLRLAATAISTSYDSSPTALRMQNWNQVVLFCNLTLDTATDVRLKVEVASPTGDSSPAAGDWHQYSSLDIASASASGGVSTVPNYGLELKLTATGKYAIPLPCNFKWLRVSAKTTGGPGSTTLLVVASQGLA